GSAKVLAYQAKKFLLLHWIVYNIAVQVNATIETSWVLRNEPARRGVVVPGAVEVEVGFGVELTTCVLEWIRDRPSRACEFAKRIRSVSLCQRACTVTQRCDRAKSISLIVIRHGTTQRGKALIDLFSLL